MLLNSIEFRVVGVTFENEEGKDVQKEIRKILNEYKRNDYFDELYGGYTNSEIKEMDLNISEYEGYDFPAKLVGDQYNGEECIKIYFKTYNNEYIHVGYTPKESLNEVIEWLTKEDITVKGTLEVVGGKYKYCEIYEEDYEEKERIGTKELTYGLEVTLNFYNNKENNGNNTKYNIKQSDLQDNNTDIVSLIIWLVLIGLGIFIFIKISSFINWLFG